MKRFKLVSAIAFMLIFTMLFSMFGTAITVPGDYDKSNKVTANDAIYLLYNTVFGDKDYPLYYDGDLNRDGRIDSDDAVYMLYSSIFGTEDYPIPDIDETGRIPIYFNDNGKVNSYELLPGDAVPAGKDFITSDFVRYDFLGWYDASLTTEYKTIPDHIVTMYAKYDGYIAYNYDFGGVYDPNNRDMVDRIKNPFGDGYVLKTIVINNTAEEYNGTYRGFSPSVYDSNSTAGFKVQRGRRYEVSFDYRYNEDAPSSATCNLTPFAVSSAGVNMDLNSSNRTQLSPAYSSTGGRALSNKGKWTECKFQVTINSDFEYFYFRFLGSSRTDAYDFYIDNLVIKDVTADNSVKLNVFGEVESTDLKVGDTLPILDEIYDDTSERGFSFDGWYDNTLTTKYTTVVDGVDTYYAKYTNYSAYSFETDGIFDPNGRYSATTISNASWWRELDPTGADNVCLRVNLSNNGSNTNVCFQAVEGATEGFKLKPGNQYIVYFRYYLDTVEVTGFPSFAFRGSTLKGIGGNGGKTDAFTSDTLGTVGKWVNEAYVFTATDAVEESPYLIMLAQRVGSSYTKVYFDDISICEFDASDDIKIPTPAMNLTFNDHGDVTEVLKSYVRSDLLAPKNYYGATFKAWYNEDRNIPYYSVPGSDLDFYAVHDGAILNFENGGVYDPNNRFGVGGISPHSIVADPTNSKNTVVKVEFNNNGNNTHFALNESGYSDKGYKLTVGNTYEISFMYYLTGNSNVSVGVQFRGCKEANIGTTGGKTDPYVNKNLSEMNAWTGVTVEFTYTGKGLESEESPYLIMNAMHTTTSGTYLYIDDIVIKETEPAKTYVQKSVKIGGWTIGYQPRPHNIVIPTYNFSYLARMQCEELEKFIENTVTTGCDVKIVTEENWTQQDNQFNIFVGDLKGHSRDNQFKVDTSSFTKDDYGIGFGGGNIYIDGGSTYALAMGVSELIKILENAKDGSTLSGRVSGKYSEKIGDYSTATYYRPTMLEDFEGTEIDTSRWHVVNGRNIAARDYVEGGVLHENQGWQSMRSAEHTYLEDGKLVIEAAYSKEDKMYYGGMLESHNKMEYRYGYLEVSCITPNGKGIWTATWLTPAGSGDGLYRSEVDINESFGDAKASNFNMHSWPKSTAYNMGFGKYSLDQISGCGSKNSTLKVGNGYADAFHTFGYLWDENSAKFIVDGRVQFQYNYDDKHTVKDNMGNSIGAADLRKNDYDTFRERLSLIVSMTVANPSSGSNPVLDADYWNTTNKYIVDYVHLYQIDGQELVYFTENN